ncbi:MAG: ABC-F family ATP-binding cassette domain-containing protein [Ardenticatenaceae bacterium]|nr:ABC-F family ATP-binding cassette domain-containing protein [Ardenticatenaceae bacterium]
MNLITLSQVTKQYGERVLLDQVDLLINEGERIGLLGRNGSGKTTLLRLLADEETPDRGEIVRWGHVRWRYVNQSPRFDPHLTVLETVFQSDAPHLQLLQQYEKAVRHVAEQPDNTTYQQEIHRLTAEMERTNGWAAEADAKAILTKLGITTFDTPIGRLSGGQQRRVALAQGLIDPGHLLILDEPTNHIDADTVAWLEEHLKGLPAAVMMVTHDRYFLENVATRIVELDRRQLISYPGNYRQYLEQRAAREAQLQQQEEKRQTWLKRELAWLHRGAQARSTKQKARKQRIEELQDIKYDRGNERVAMSLASRRLGKRVLEARNLSKTLGGIPLFTNLDFDLIPGDRLGIVGPNGTGKSTLLNVLSGLMPADQGEVKWGSTVELGYFDQLNSELEENQQRTALEYIEDKAPLIHTAGGERVTAGQMLEWFLFPRPEQRTQIGSLSGGEQRRLYLLRTLITQPNVLLLDEPTNDLDVQTLTVLEQFLDHFKGCLIVVSHDRYFLDRNVDYIMPFAAGVLGTKYPSPYRPAFLSPSAANGSVKKSPQKSPSSTEKKTRLTWKENRELEALEIEIADLETQIAEFESSINQAGSDYEKLQRLTAELDLTNEALENKMARWLELSEKQAG